MKGSQGILGDPQGPQWVWVGQQGVKGTQSTWGVLKDPSELGLAKKGMKGTQWIWGGSRGSRGGLWGSLTLGDDVGLGGHRGAQGVGGEATEATLEASGQRGVDDQSPRAWEH